MTTAKDKFENASQTYAKAAKNLERRLTDPKVQTEEESERLIGLGVAIDWTRRASHLHPLNYDSKFLNKSARSPGVTEMVRFNLAWSGMNALFSRPSILNLFGGTTAKSELQRFRFLYGKAGLTAATAADQESALQQLLAIHINTRVPGVPAGQTVTTLHSLFYKYTPSDVQNMATGKVIRNALTSGNFSALDLPLLIYAMRNWSVHGGIIGSSFRSDTRFDMYIGTVQMALADVHETLAKKLLTIV
ncbi:hypothetical protein [Roseateles sp. P5_D6]